MSLVLDSNTRGLVSVLFNVYLKKHHFDLNTALPCCNLDVSPGCGTVIQPNPLVALFSTEGNTNNYFSLEKKNHYHLLVFWQDRYSTSQEKGLLLCDKILIVSSEDLLCKHYINL